MFNLALWKKILLIIILHPLLLQAYYSETLWVKISFSISFILVTIFIFTKWGSGKQLNTDIHLFTLIEKDNLEGFKKYVTDHYSRVKDLENVFYYGQMTVLLYAIGKKKVNICKYLLDNGFDVNFQTSFCELPIIYAVFYNYKEIVDLLLEYKPNLELRSHKFKSTALETVVYRNKPDYVEKLMNQGAKFSISAYAKTLPGEMNPWQNVKTQVKRAILKQVIFQKKLDTFNIYDLSMKKKLNLPIFSTRHYFMENFLQI